MLWIGEEDLFGGDKSSTKRHPRSPETTPPPTAGTADKRLTSDRKITKSLSKNHIQAVADEKKSGETHEKTTSKAQEKKTNKTSQKRVS